MHPCRPSAPYNASPGARSEPRARAAAAEVAPRLLRRFEACRRREKWAKRKTYGVRYCGQAAPVGDPHLLHIATWTAGVYNSRKQWINAHLRGDSLPPRWGALSPQPDFLIGNGPTSTPQPEHNQKIPKLKRRKFQTHATGGSSRSPHSSCGSTSPAHSRSYKHCSPMASARWRLPPSQSSEPSAAAGTSRGAPVVMQSDAIYCIAVWSVGLAPPSDPELEAFGRSWYFSRWASHWMISYRIVLFCAVPRAQFRINCC
jgi:hypothetical protein